MVMRVLQPLDSTLSGSSIPRGVYLSGGTYTAWVSGAPGAPALPTHLLWYIDYSESTNLKGYVHYLDHTEMTAYGYSGGIFPAVPGITLTVDVSYVPGESEGPDTLDVVTVSDAALEASATVTATNRKAVAFDTSKLEFTEIISDKSNTVRSLYRKAVLSETKGVFAGDPVFSLTAASRRRAQNAASAEEGKVYYLGADGRITDNIRTAISRAAVGQPSGEWRTVNRKIYVNFALATGNNDGTTPGNAYRGVGCIAAAIADADSKSVLLRESVQILVAGGVYPQEGMWGIRYKVRVYGGFDPDFTVRDFDSHPTILDGENTLHGSVSATEAGVIDGFTITNITGGNWGGSGLAVNLQGSAVLRSCKIVDNTSIEPSFTGTALAFFGGRAVNCYFENNVSAAAGKSSIYWGAGWSGSMINCVVVGDNLGIYSNRIDAKIINCTLIDDGSKPGEAWITVDVSLTAPFNIDLTGTVIYGTYAGKKNFLFPTSSPAPSQFPINLSKVLLRGGVSGLNLYASGTYYYIGEMVYTLSAGVYTSYYCIKAGYNHTPASSPTYWRVIDETEVVSWWDPQLDTDYTPLPGSPCIDAGDIAAYTGATSPAYGLSTDFYDNPRYKTDGGGVPVSVDIGAVQKQD
jgi:hypothetical protein